MNKDSIKKLINAAIAKQKAIGQKAIGPKPPFAASDKDPLFTEIEKETLNFIQMSDLEKFYVDPGEIPKVLFGKIQIITGR